MTFSDWLAHKYGDDYGTALRRREDRRERWFFVIDSLVGGLSDEGIVKWLELDGGNLDRMVARAEGMRGGMIAS